MYKMIDLDIYFFKKIGAHVNTGTTPPGQIIISVRYRTVPYRYGNYG